MIKDFKVFSFNTENIWRLFLSFCVALSILSSSQLAVAEDTDKVSEDPFGKKLCEVVKVLNGGAAKAVATVAIFALGVGLFMGRLNWGTVAITSLGVITIFSANSVISWLSGGIVKDEECK